MCLLVLRITREYLFIQKKLKIYVRVQSAVVMAKDRKAKCPSTHEDTTSCDALT